MRRSPPYVSRRAFLAGVSASVVGSAVPAAAHPTPDSDGTGTALPESNGTTGELDPLGRATVRGAKEAVVDPAGKTAYVAATDGFATVDLSDPGSPQVLAERRGLLADRQNGPMAQVFDAKLDDDRLLVVGPANPTDVVHAALLYDVSDPAAPERMAVHETDYPIHNCDLAGDVAYLTGNDGDRNALVLIDTDAGQELGRWSVVDVDERWADVDPILRVVHDVRVQDGVAYLAYWDAGTWLVDVSDPASPSLLAKVRGRPPDELATLGRSEVRIEQGELPGNDHYVAPNDDGSLLGIGMEAWDNTETSASGGPGGIELWDISDPSNPTRQATISPPPTPDPTFDGVWTTSHNFEFRGDRLYTSWYRGGVRLFDVSDPTHPHELRAWRDRDRASFWTAQAAVPGSFFVASSVGQSGALPSRTPTGGIDEPAGVYTFPEPPLDASTGTGSADPSGVTGVLGTGFGAVAGLAGLGAWLVHRAWTRA